MAKVKINNNKLFKVIVLISVVCYLTLSSVIGQINPGTAGGTPQGSYPLSDIDTINYYTGKVSLSIPIYKLGGRGEAQIPVSIQFDQNSWIKKFIIDYNENYLYYAERGNDIFTASTINNAFAMFPDLKIQQSTYGENYCREYNNIRAQKTLTTLQFTVPNGTSFELRDQQYGGRINEISSCVGSGLYLHRGNVFISADGSNAMFVADQPIDDYIFPGVSPLNGGTPAGYLYLSDGTTYRFETNGVSWMRDRNGNLINAIPTTQNSDGTYTSGLKDSIDRKLLINSPLTTNTHLINKITYSGSGGSERNVLIHFALLEDALKTGQTLKTYHQLFPQLNFQIDTDFNPEIISKIVLPDNREYRLFYNSYGDIARIELPTGAVIEYDWQGAAIGGPDEGEYAGDSGVIQRRVVERRLYSDGVNLTQKMIIGRVNPTDSNVAITVDTYGSTSLIYSVKHYYYGNPLHEFNPYDMYPPWKDGKEYQTQMFAQDGTTLLRQTNQTWYQTPPSWYVGSADNAPSNNPKIIETKTLLADSNQVSKKTFTYDSRNNLTDTYEYDYGIGTPGALLRRSHSDYLTVNPVNNTDYTSNNIHILNLPSQSWVSSDSAGNNKFSLTKFEYDNYTTDQNHAALLNRYNISGHHSDYSTSYETRGNVTKVTSYADANNQTGDLGVHTQYDIAGNSVKTIDARGYATTADYSDRFGSPDAEARSNTAPSGLNGQNTFAFATSVTNSLGWTTYAQFDYYSGQGVDAEDILGTVGTIYYNDVLDRPTQTITANNLSNYRRQTTISYDDTNRKVTVTADLLSFGDNLAKTESFYDKMGRTIESRKYETGGYSATNTIYDKLGRVEKVTSPYRSFLNETPLWTTTEYDALGRVVKVRTPDNAEVTKSYSGNATTIIDQAGKKRKGISDALGRMTRVIEDPNGQNLVTDYVFDVLGNLRKTVQGEQSRYFMYNSLGRLLYAKQPEQNANTNFIATDSITGNSQWSVKYLYDNNGNVISTTDANGTSVTGTYDNLNRLTGRDYSDSTPDVTFTYDDPAIPFSKGRLTKVSSIVSETRYTSFDNTGQLLTHQQITDGQTYNTAYSYNLAGGLIEQTYPSGRVVKNTFDQEGDLTQVQSRKANTGFYTYANGFVYNTVGAVQKMRLGNGRWETISYDDNRQLVTQIGLGVTDSDQNLLKLEYNYGAATQNNGSLKEQKITVPTVGTSQGFTATQTYGYDDLNRLQSSTETVASQQTWKQIFQYDRYGNRRFDAANTTTLGNCLQAICNPTISTSDNRFSIGQGYSYDPAGNLKTDAEGRQFFYDAENHQKEVKNASNQTIGLYLYDGEGKRVKKISAQEETVFVYNGAGQLVAEYSTALSQTPQVSYLTTDALGSPRIVTDRNGNVISRKDYSAFGDETFTAQRTQGLGYQPDPVRQDYTGYQKDDESGLDYAQARYYNPAHGRFTSVDPLTASASIINPQTFNRYSYGLNSPYKFTDSLGLRGEDISCFGSRSGGGEITCEAQNNLDTYDQNLQNTMQSNAANRAIANNDQATAEAICASNSNITCERSEPTVTVTATLDDTTFIIANGEPGTYHNVGQNFVRAAETEISVLEGNGVRALNFGTVRSVSGFQGLLDMAEKYGAYAIVLFTHGGTNSVYLGDGDPDDNNTITLNSVKKLVNRSSSLSAIWIYGCNAGSSENGIAQKLATQLGVMVFASTTGMQFSDKPNRLSDRKVHPSSGPTYMVSEGAGMFKAFAP